MVEAEALGHVDQASAAQLGPQRGEHRVAGDRERVQERAPACLAARVVQRVALDRRARGDREGVRQLDDSRLECAGGGDDLHRRARRLSGGEGHAGQREQPAGPGIHGGHSAVAPGQRGDRRPFDGRHDRGGHVMPALRVAPGQHAPAGQQHAAGRSGQLGLERALESVLTHLGVGRISLRRVAGRVGGRDRPKDADDLERDVRDRRGAVGAPGQRRPVGGEQRGAGGERHVSGEPLASAQPGEQERWDEVHRRARASAGQRDLEHLPERAEQPGPHGSCAPGSRRRASCPLESG